MSKIMTRRKFMGKTGQALAAGGTAVYGGSALTAQGATHDFGIFVHPYGKVPT